MLVTEGELLDAAERYAHSVIDKKEFITIAEQWAKSLNDGKPIVSGALPPVSREELISSLEDKRICKRSNLPVDIYYLSRKETADYLMDNYVIAKRQ